MRRREFHQCLISTGIAAAVAGPAMGEAAGDAEASRDKIKIGQIGTAHGHASGKMATIRRFPDLFDVVGIVESDPGRRAGLERSAVYRGVPVMTEDELLSTPGLQAVCVETAVDELVPTAARCIAAGKHIHLDKPAGQSLSAFKNVLDRATQQSLVVQMGYMLRYNPAFQFMFQAVRDGWLGEVFEIHAVMSKTVNAAARRQLAEYPGGSMFELGCHLIDAVVAVMGAPEKVTAFPKQTRPDVDALADNMLAVLEYPRATATVRSALIEVDGFRRRQFVICGDQGTIEIIPLESCRLVLTLDRPRGKYGKGTQVVELPRPEGRYDGDFVDLAKVIRGEKKNDYPPAHDLAVHRAVLLASGCGLEIGRSVG